MTDPPSGRHAHAGARPVGALALLTVSDTRSAENDVAGRTMRDRLTGAGHRIVDQRIVPDDPDAVREQILAWLARPDCDGVVVSGGTGISVRDRTYEAVVSLIDKRLDGFGELFRVLSYQTIGSAAMLSRAVAGVARGKIVFSIPGAPAAVELALDALIVPELPHLLSELAK